MRILHTNDFHGTLDDAKQAVLAGFRKDADLYFDCGDCIKAGNLALPMRPEPVWPRLADLHCTASVIGNRESHPLEAAFRAKIEGAKHPLLCGNMHRRSNGEEVLPRSMLLEVGGFKVGVLAVMVPMVTSRVATRLASQFLWDEPITTAIKLAGELRDHVDCLIALTHIGFRKDVELASKCPELDLILGGHSHTLLKEPEMVGRVAICQTGSHGRFCGIYDWRADSGLSSYELKSLA